jgi:hypothetical protein
MLLNNWVRADGAAMMRSWLSDRFDIETALSPGEVFVRLRSDAADDFFAGTVDASGFCLTRRSRFRNDFRPILVGTLLGGGAGSIVAVEVELSPRAGFFPFSWLAFIGASIVAGTVDWTRHPGPPYARAVAVYAPLVLGVLATAAVFLSYRSELKRARRALESLLAA